MRWVFKSHYLSWGAFISLPSAADVSQFWLRWFLALLIKILDILFITFAFSGLQCLSAHFPQSGGPANPYWNITHSLYDICEFWASVPPGPFSPIWSPSKSLLKYHTFSLWHLRILGLSASRPIFPNLKSLQILTEISYILCMTFADSGPQCLLAHFPQSGAPPNPYWNITHSLDDIC
jgi:hypothetical protein